VSNQDACFIGNVEEEEEDDETSFLLNLTL
jgi:hypothetical protein